ncbi:protein phosphatase 1, regulatory (inhibitor) subunit 14Aa isoform X2 [Girardinichthys multiradiatus]|uniref:protein phosphatase 1, regulatory (inhibitor) subunit 14Aa isoform X2 n=1 Tax=Girardinichthys multiradiatus TaxID=208333 RepID=UPI001FABB108|nr:protein phosphatase 1, regulatory (inhibitor) subunit 14Aa isoform X2 [Girardinichthys multiradiatus]
MATDGSGTTLEENDELLSDPEPGGNIPKRHARVTVKYNRKELQRRLDVEKWIDESLDRLYRGQESDMPEEVNIDDLIDLRTDEERIQKLKELLHNCSNNTEVPLPGGAGEGTGAAHLAYQLGSIRRGRACTSLPERFALAVPYLRIRRS